MSAGQISKTDERMSHMNRSDIVRAGATPEFVTLCKTLYGDLIDADEIWQTVVKASPDQADLHAQSNRTKFERGSNAVGLSAGLLATGAALRDSRFGDEKAGKVANKLHALATHRRIPTPLSNRSGKAGAALAAGALGTQVLNTVGDVAIGSSYSDRAKKQQQKTARRAARKQGKLRSTGRQQGTKAAADMASLSGIMPKFNDVVTGARSQTKQIAGMFSPTGVKAKPVSSVPKNNGTVGGNTKPKKPTGNSLETTAKADVEWEGTFSKLDTDKHLAFGWASVSKVNGQPIVDKQGDYIDPGDLEDAAYEYVLKSRVGGAMHARDLDDKPVKVADIVESMVFTDDKVAKMGLPENFNRGWWVGMKIHNADEWELVKKGNNGGRTGFSIHGRGIRKSQDLDELMGYVV